MKDLKEYVIPNINLNLKSQFHFLKQKRLKIRT